MFLARIEIGSCIWNTATTDNAVQKHYLNVDRQLLPGFAYIPRQPWLKSREIAAEIDAAGNGIFVASMQEMEETEKIEIVDVTIIFQERTSP
jgi:hypothetical protein